MPSTSRLTSPEYERPPVVETVVGVQFDPIANFGNAQLGAFWKTLDRSEWVSVTDAPPVPPQFEQFGEAMKWPPQLTVQFSQTLRTRLQIKNRAGDRMIQFQHGRVHFNWLGKGGTDYPRYAAVREGFIDVFRKFVTFVSQENLGDVRPNQWEVTYINNIPQGTVWNSPSDWNFFKPLSAVPTIPDIVQGESFSGEWHFLIPGKRGRLHAHWEHGLAPGSEQPRLSTVWLTFTARGSVEIGEEILGSVLAGVDLGHTTIVQSFRSLMSDQANAYWGLKA